MNMLEAFEQLDKLNESAIDDLRGIISEINELDQEINSLKDQKYNSDTAKKINQMQKELWQLGCDISNLKDTYRTREYTEFDSDGDPTDWEYIITDENQKAAVAEQEAALEQKYAELNANFKELQKIAETEEVALKLKNKTSVLKSKEERKKAIVNAVIEEDRPELEKIIADANKHVKLTPDWKKVSQHNGKIYLKLISDEFDYEVDHDYIEYDGDEPYIDTDKLYNNLEEYILEEPIYEVAYSLINNDEVVDSLKREDRGELLDIPGSSWKFLFDFDLDYVDPEINHYSYTPATYWEPADSYIDYDETVSCQVIYYLVKEI